MFLNSIPTDSHSSNLQYIFSRLLSVQIYRYTPSLSLYVHNYDHIIANLQLAFLLLNNTS